MIRNQSDRNILLRILLVINPCHTADLIPDCTHRVDIKDRANILHYGSESLETHAGIDILILQLRIMAIAIPIKLGKYIIPDLNETVTVTAHLTAGLTAAVFLTAIIIDLGTGTTGTCPMLPEIICLSHTVNPVCRNTDLLIPDIISLIILLIDRRIETVRIKTDNFSEELPGPGNRLMLKVVPEGEITKHLKKGSVSGSFTDILNITGADTFLAGSHSLTRRNLLSGKIGL